MAVGPGLDEHVRRQRRKTTADRPDVQVVHVGHVRHGEHRLPDLARLGRRDLEQDPRRLAQQQEARPEDQPGDDEARNRVGAVPAGGQHDRACDRRAGEGGEVGRDVQERAAHIQALGARPVQQRGGDQVDGDPGERDRQHQAAAHLGRVDEAAHRCVDDHDADHEQRDPVHMGGENLQTSEAERPAPARRPAGQREGAEREGERRGVGEHVARVREQRQRAGDHAEHDLARHQAEDQPERDHQRSPRGGVGVRVAHVSILAGADQPSRS